MENRTCPFCGGNIIEMNGSFYCWSCDRNYVLQNEKLVALICKSCGGDLIEKGDFYQCEICGKKTEKSFFEQQKEEPKNSGNVLNSVKNNLWEEEENKIVLFTDAAGYKEEAKRITDVIDNFSGFGYRKPIGQHDKTRAKARKFAEEKKYSLASEHYEAILMEDDWEPFFYSVYCKVFYQPDLKFDAKGMLERIEPTAERILHGVPKKKQRDTYLEVGMETLRMGLYLLEKGEKEKFFPSRNPAIYIPFGEEDFENLKEETAIMMATAAIIINNTFEDPYSAEIVAKTAKDICVLWGITGEVFKSLETACEKLGKMTEELKRSAEEIKANIAKLEKAVLENPEKQELEKLDKEIDALIKKKASLGFFKKSEKKETEKKIESLSKSRQTLYLRVVAFEEAVFEEKENLSEILEEIQEKIGYS